MAFAQTRSDILGTSASKKAVNSAQNSFTQWASETATTGVTTSGCIGLSVYVLFTFGSTGGQTNTIEVFTSQDGTNYDTDAYASYVIAGANSTTKAATIPLAYAEDIMAIKVKITASTSAGSTCDCWISLIKVTP